MKRKILLLILASALTLTGCVINSKEPEKETLEYAKSDDVGVKENRPYEEIVANVDFSKPHIQVELKDKLTVDADIPAEVPNNLGIYSYEDVLEVNEGNEQELRKANEAEAVKLIDEYFGEDVTVTVDEAVAGGGVQTEYGTEYFFNVSCNVGNISFTNCMNNEYSKYIIGNTWEYKYPNIESDYDGVMIESKIEEFVNHFSSILPGDLSDEYRCLHFDEIFWKTSGEKVADEWGIENTLDKDYYWIRMYCEVEQDIHFNKGDTNVQFEGIGETSWPRAFEDVGMVLKLLRNRYLDTYVDIYLDENGELFAFEIYDRIDIAECVDDGEVLSKKDALGKLYNVYAKATVYEQITVNEMKLTYAAVPDDTVDENGYRAAYVKPIWMFYLIKGEGKSNCNIIVFDAVTGELIYRSDVVRGY